MLYYNLFGMDDHNGASGVFEIAIIGAGIVGLAVGKELVERGYGPVVILEGEAGVARHQTGHNSGVIHSGLYYRPGSLRAKNCVEGREMMYSFCEEYGIAHERCGKLVVAVEERELTALDRLEERGRANGLKIKRVSGEEIKEYEPYVEGLSALWVPETGIVDYKKVAEAYVDIFKSKGGELRMNSKVVRVNTQGGISSIFTTSGTVQSRFVINCSGVQADRVARICGFKPGVRIVPFRGEYYELINRGPNYVRNLIYPVPDDRFPFLGVHFTRMIEGGVEAGPNAVLAFSRNGYSVSDINVRDLWNIFTYWGFWQLARKYWEMGFAEFLRSLSKRRYLRSLKRIIPDITAEDITKGGSGVRAQVLGLDGKLIDDFWIESEENMIHVLNAPSPAATASLSIARSIVDMAEDKFVLSGKL